MLSYFDRLKINVTAVGSLLILSNVLAILVVWASSDLKMFNKSVQNNEMSKLFP